MSFYFFKSQFVIEESQRRNSSGVEVKPIEKCWLVLDSLAHAQQYSYITQTHLYSYSNFHDELGHHINFNKNNTPETWPHHYQIKANMHLKASPPDISKFCQVEHKKTAVTCWVTHLSRVKSPLAEDLSIVLNTYFKQLITVCSSRFRDIWHLCSCSTRILVYKYQYTCIHTNINIYI